jgi:ABC-type glutathione transport system ATPase component
MTLVEVSGVSKSFLAPRSKLLSRSRPKVSAVTDVSFRLDVGRTLAVVGESGSGKSTLGRLVLRLIEPDHGRILIDGTDVRSLSQRDLRRFRAKNQIVFQDPKSSLNPRRTIEAAVTEPLGLHTNMTVAEQRRRAGELLGQVGLPASVLSRYPAQLSGGQLQRVAIARTLALDPRFIVCDEVVAALDASIRAHVLNLLADLQAVSNIAYLFITHDMATVGRFADELLVMRAGQVVESGPVGDVLTSPQHDYTRELISAIPNPVPRNLRPPSDPGVLAAGAAR